MRLCYFQRFGDTKEPIHADKPEGPFRRGWSEMRKGVFLEWGLDSDDGASFTVALVEDEEGNIHEVIPSRIKFTEKLFSKVWKE